MFDTTMYDHIQQYRLRWHRAKTAVEQNDSLDVDYEDALRNYHAVTRSWVQRLLSLDTVEDAYQHLWHEQELGDYTGLNDAYENGLRTESFGIENPLDADTLTEIGKATEQMTVDATDLPQQPPVDPDPWEPTGLSDDLKDRLENVREDIPHDL
jgi:hypothetical protein